MPAAMMPMIVSRGSAPVQGHRRCLLRVLIGASVAVAIAIAPLRCPETSDGVCLALE